MDCCSRMKEDMTFFMEKDKIYCFIWNRINVIFLNNAFISKQTKDFVRKKKSHSNFYQFNTREKNILSCDIENINPNVHKQLSWPY